MPANPLLGPVGHSALVWTPAAACTVIVSLRIWLRARLHILGAEDQLMVIAWIFQIIAAGLTQGNISAVGDSAHDIVRMSTRSLYTSLSCVISIVCGKISVALLLLRLMGHASRWRKWSVIASVAVLIGLSVTFLPANTLSVCDYTEGEDGLMGCMDEEVSEGLVQTWNFYAAALDIFYSILPISFLYRLRMDSRKKVGVIVLLGAGWIASVFTILRAVGGYAWGDDSDTAIFVHLLANYMEPALVIICGSLATLMPLSEQWSFKRFSRAKTRDSYQPSPVCEKKVSSDSTVKQDVRPVRKCSAGDASVDELLPQIWVERRFSVNVSDGDHV